jgi:hypothetical protein
MTATPRAVPSYDDEYIDTPFRIIPDSVVAYQNVLYTFGDWFENAGFDVDFRVTPLRLTLAAFMLGWLQLAFMIWFGDYELPLKTVKCLFRGFHSVSILYLPLILLPLFTNQLKTGLKGTLVNSPRLDHVLYIRSTDGEPHQPCGR